MTKNKMHILTLLLLIILHTGCEENGDDPITRQDSEFPSNAYLPTFSNVYIELDKAVYTPGSEVNFSIAATTLPKNLKVRYKYLGQVIEESVINNARWKWQIPQEDFRAYMAEVFLVENDKETIYSTIAVDVSSDWTKFPRYGFLSDYSELTDETMESVMKNLTRHHINGIQFYDWHNKHHQPMEVDGSNHKSLWKDIANRDIYFSTVEKYIQRAHDCNMKAMFYNLVYGAWENADKDGVSKEWYAYKDAAHMNREVMTLPSPPFLSDIFLLDPSNTEWQHYIQNENKKVYDHLDFDGYHMDQLGDWGLHYKYDGEPLHLDRTFEPFIESIRAGEPQKYIAMNAVNQYGQQGIASSSANFLYTEVWTPNNNYSDLASIIQVNSSFSNNTKNTVLAAYMNYDIAENKGYFNTPGVLLTNAVIFAFGGSHLELGEHMLGKEYFPNNNLVMKTELKTAMVGYYDFLVAYQNLLRDGGEFNVARIVSSDGKLPISKWPAPVGSVAAIGKTVKNSQVIHLINFKDANSTEWRDAKGTQSMPALIKDAQVSIDCSQKVKNVWFASPDVIGGASFSLEFIQEGNQVSLTIPELKYWSMIVLEYEQ